MSSLIHEPSEPVERLEGGYRVRKLTGRVRPAEPGLNPYVFAMLRASDYIPEPAEGFERVGVSFVPAGLWCEYEVVDRATAPAGRRRALPAGNRAG